MNKKLSILIPTYNEGKTLPLLLAAIQDVKLENIEKEIIVINDCSNDTTDEEVEKYLQHHPDSKILYLCHKKNLGKGAALHTGILAATGNYILIQDADLEYDPHEYPILLKPMLDGFADVVYGSRFISGNPHRILFFWHTLGNKFLTFISNLFTNLNLTDMEVCYKLFRADILKSLTLQEKRFGFEPEVTAKISKIQGIRIYEVGISYYGRTYREGKKINWKDGIHAIYCILKYNLVSK
ncbi:MAG TPA: glycosyltransferase family 2 protein [Cytophagaceae bacterium]|nr:glycosyltransferase family 2 protein [Cytophagaceae bacterium]